MRRAWPNLPRREPRFPELGSPANAAISIDDEYHAGLAYVNEIRKEGVILTDPEVSQYAQEIGHSLSSHAEEGQHQFYYFVIREPTVNAFAIPGGFVAIHSGLITRRATRMNWRVCWRTKPRTSPSGISCARSWTRATKDCWHPPPCWRPFCWAQRRAAARPMRSRAPFWRAQSAMIQHQINYTRSSEFEADRIGIRPWRTPATTPWEWPASSTTWAAPGPEPSRVNAVQFLIDHPIFSDRVAEARRSRQSNRPDPTRRLLGLSAHPRTAANRGRRSAGRAPVLRQPAEEWRRKDHSKNATAKTWRTLRRAMPAAAIPDLQELVREYPKVTQFYGALGQAYLVEQSVQRIRRDSGAER